MKDEDSENLVTVYQTSNHAIIAVVKSILDEAGIEYYSKGDNMQNIVAIYAFPVEFQVMPENVEFARELLKDVGESENDEPNQNAEEGNV